MRRERNYDLGSEDLAVLAAIGSLHESRTRPPYSIKDIRQRLVKEGYQYSSFFEGGATRHSIGESLKLLQKEGLVVLTKRNKKVGAVPLTDPSSKLVLGKEEEKSVNRALKIEYLTGRPVQSLMPTDRLLLLARRLKRDTPYSEGGEEYRNFIKAVRDREVIDLSTHEGEALLGTIETIIDEVGLGPNESESESEEHSKPITYREAGYLVSPSGDRPFVSFVDYPGSKVGG